MPASCSGDTNTINKKGRVYCMGWSFNDAASPTDLTASHEITIIMHSTRLRTQITLAVADF